MIQGRKSDEKEKNYKLKINKLKQNSDSENYVHAFIS